MLPKTVLSARLAKPPNSRISESQHPNIMTYIPFSTAGFVVAVVGLVLIMAEPRPLQIGTLSRVVRGAYYVSTAYFLFAMLFFVPIVRELAGPTFSDWVLNLDLFDGDEFQGAVAYKWQFINAKDFERLHLVAMFQILVLLAVLSVSRKNSAGTT